MSKYTLVSRNFGPLANTHNGTGLIRNAAHGVVPSTVVGKVSDPMEFRFQNYAVVVMSLEIETNDAPNWFGVGFRKGIQSFDTVNIFCHPHPGHAGMAAGDYRTRGGTWPRLFRYVEMFARQMDFAKKDILFLMPFFTDDTYASTGLFGPNWRDLVEQALELARAAAAGTAEPATDRRRVYVPEINPLVLSSATAKKGQAGRGSAPASGRLRNVLLSDFSRGRALMTAFRRSAPGLGQMLREVWDFDGLASPAPVSAGGVRGILYNQERLDTRPGTTVFHVPPERWEQFHKTKTGNVHSNIPDLLAWHAATVSAYG